jgi:hypothetical protein
VRGVDVGPVVDEHLADGGVARVGRLVQTRPPVFVSRLRQPLPHGLGMHEARYRPTEALTARGRTYRERGAALDEEEDGVLNTGQDGYMKRSGAGFVLGSRRCTPIEKEAHAFLADIACARAVERRSATSVRTAHVRAGIQESRHRLGRTSRGSVVKRSRPVRDQHQISPRASVTHDST